MTSRATSLAAEGASVVSATAQGIHSAFVYGAIISLVAIPIAFFIRKPASNGAAAPVGH